MSPSKILYNGFVCLLDVLCLICLPIPPTVILSWSRHRSSDAGTLTGLLHQWKACYHEITQRPNAHQLHNAVVVIRQTLCTNSPDEAVYYVYKQTTLSTKTKLVLSQNKTYSAGKS